MRTHCYPGQPGCDSKSEALLTSTNEGSRRYVDVMPPEENPKEIFAGTEAFKSPATPDPTRICPACDAVLTKPDGWMASAELQPTIQTRALYCEKCDDFYVDAVVPVLATTHWKTTNQG